jgi:hypothetical protein
MKPASNITNFLLKKSENKFGSSDIGGVVGNVGLLFCSKSALVV